MHYFEEAVRFDVVNSGYAPRCDEPFSKVYPYHVIDRLYPIFLEHERLAFVRLVPNAVDKAVDNAAIDR